MATIPLAFAGEPPDLQPSDELTPPNTLEIHGFVWFERVDPRKVHMRQLATEARWKHSGTLYQVARAESSDRVAVSLGCDGSRRRSAHPLRRRKPSWRREDNTPRGIVHGAGL